MFLYDLFGFLVTTNMSDLEGSPIWKKKPSEKLAEETSSLQLDPKPPPWIEAAMGGDSKPPWWITRSYRKSRMEYYLDQIFQWSDRFRWEMFL